MTSTLHFWPGSGNPNERPGALSFCGTRAVPLLSTAIPSKVTCRKCLRHVSPILKAAQALGRADVPVLWSDAELQAQGLLAADAPPPAPPPAPYRNPRLVDPGRDPFTALVERIRARAEREPEARFALRSVAAELEDLILNVRNREVWG